MSSFVSVRVGLKSDIGLLQVPLWSMVNSVQVVSSELGTISLSQQGLFNKIYLKYIQGFIQGKWILGPK
ncbi:hypothetical protein FGO68_gene17184 [Halteria grandinella]|uniref:Uncharacterized protein n=1 Tax=Halteria grandinella TaxID=5974 RepID=A0A8J8P622_HALGN|nr:hypothetical protein FGO68_gene17184 [Halteria grandinella]